MDFQPTLSEGTFLRVDLHNFEKTPKRVPNSLILPIVFHLTFSSFNRGEGNWDKREWVKPFESK